MAIAYRSGSTAGNASGGNLTVNAPAGLTDGDILVAICYNEIGASAWTAPAGWTQWGTGQADFAANAWINVYWKRASGEGSSYTFNISTTWRTISLAAFSGCYQTGDPIQAGPTGLNYSTFISPEGASITTVQNNEMCVFLTANYDGTDVTSGSSGYTQGAELGGCEIWYNLKVTAGSTGVVVFSRASGQAENWATYHLSLKEATTIGYTGGVGAGSTHVVDYGYIFSSFYGQPYGNNQRFQWQPGWSSTHDPNPPITIITASNNYNSTLSGSVNISGSIIKQAKKLLSGTITTTGSLIKSGKKIISGTLTLSGVINTNINKLKQLSATLTIGGTLIKNTAKSFVGTLTSSGVLVKSAKHLLSSTLTSAATLTKLTQKNLSGAIGTITGSISKTSTKILSGSISTISGSITKQTRKIISGILTQSGILSKQMLKILNGVLNQTGALIKQTLAILSGLLTLSGSITKKITKLLSGAITSSGNLIKNIIKVFSGTLVITGSLIKNPIKVLLSTLYLTATIQKNITKILNSILSISGSLIYQITKVLNGSISPSGNVQKYIKKLLDSTLSIYGLLETLNGYFVNLNSALNPTGTINKFTNINLSGIITLYGLIYKDTIRILSSSLDFLGNLLYNIKRFIALDSNLGFIGNLNKISKKLLDGNLNFVGLLNNNIIKKLYGALSFVGDLIYNEAITIILSATLSSSGNLIKKSNKILNGLLVSSGQLSKNIFIQLVSNLSFIGNLIGHLIIVISGKSYLYITDYLFSDIKDSIEILNTIEINDLNNKEISLKDYTESSIYIEDRNLNFKGEL